MARLKKYRVDLEKRINSIIYHFRFTQELTGITPAQEDKLRGIIALSHAEIEDYFETVALSLYQDSIKLWNLKRTANYNLASLFMLGDRPEKKLNHGNTLFKIKELYENSVNRNHGIKRENIHTLFYPLGYEEKDFDPMLLSQLESFGSLRGSIVHTSANKAKNPLDQKTTINMIQDILKLLPSFEKTLLSKI